MYKALILVGAGYLAVALVWLGLQIPVRLATCEGAVECVGGLLIAPFWALLWPLHGWISGLLPPLALQALFFFTLPSVAAALLVQAWNRWAGLDDPPLRQG